MQAGQVFNEAMDHLLSSSGQAASPIRVDGDWLLDMGDGAAVHVRLQEQAQTVLLFARLGPVASATLCEALLQANWRAAPLGLVFSLEEPTGCALAAQTLALSTLTPASLVESVERFAGQVRGWSKGLAAGDAGAPDAQLQPIGLLRV